MFASVVILVVYALTVSYVQAVQGDKLAAAAERQRLQTSTLNAMRGNITDVAGVPLAVTIAARDVTVDQTQVVDPSASAARLAVPLQVSPETLVPRLTGTRRFVYLARGITPEQWATVQALNVPGVYSEPTTRRVYPAGDVAANVVGFVDSEGRGAGGLEYGLERELAGVDGKQTVELAPGGREIPDGAQSGTEAVPGTSVRLTINRDVQWMAQRELESRVAESKADGGSVVVMDSKTGAIVALASTPTFDPNQASEGSGATMGNGALMNTFEPGSTSKVMTLAAAVDEGGMTPTSELDVPLSLRIAGKTFRDSSVLPSQQLTLTGVMARSSNIGTIMAAKTVGPQRMYDYLKKFGVAEPTGLNFPAESRGQLPAPARWSGTSFPTIAFGQGLSMNSVQVASVYATIANGGVRVAPTLVSGYTNPDGTQSPAPTPATTRVVSARTAAMVTAMLESVTTEGGTAPLAAIPGYRVAGKTGTALRNDPACGCYRGYVSSFVGFAPADAPRLVVGVTIDNPRQGHFGGQLAGPVFQKVMTFALQEMRIPPTGAAKPNLPLTW